MEVTETQIIQALRRVQDPELFKDIVTLNMVKRVKIFDGQVMIDIELTTPAPPLKERVEKEITAAVLAVPGVTEVMVNISANARAPAAPGTAPAAAGGKNILPAVKNIIAVGAGKGGVGKSTIAVNIAACLAMQGAKVGLLDADIYGPSVPTLTGLPAQPPTLLGNRIVPFQIHPAGAADISIKVMSIGFMVEKEKALIWRGPMAHGAVKQFLEQVEWGDLDYLVVDLPPGTGDVSLTVAQTVALTGAVIVATPQEVALMDARRAVRMFQQLGVEILGVVENMSYFTCEHGTQYDIFGRGGAKAMAEKMGVPFLGEVPIDMRLRVHSDAGTPFENFAAGNGAGPHMQRVVQTLSEQIAVRNTTRPAARQLRLEVS